MNYKCRVVFTFPIFSFNDDFHVVNCLQDNVFVNVVASVQYRALADKASDAFYRLSNTREQIQSYVFDGKAATHFKLQNSHLDCNAHVVIT
jgi:hypothetical protein